jgi:hypothetical protein
MDTFFYYLHLYFIMFLNISSLSILSNICALLCFRKNLASLVSSKHEHFSSKNCGPSDDTHNTKWQFYRKGANHFN